MTKKFKVGLISICVIFLILSVVFFFYDLEISKAIATDQPNFFLLLLAAVGEFPIYIGPILFGLVYGFTSENKHMKIGAHLVGLAATYVGMFRLSKGICKYFFSSKLVMSKYILLAIAALLLYVLLIIILNKVNKEQLYKLRDIALIYLLVSVSSFVIVSGAKLLWGRPRYRILSSDYSEYSNFLTIHGFGNSKLGDDYRSFPSGHTNSAASILVLGLIPMRFTNKKWIKYSVFGLTFLYVICVAVSRICMGAHYASDVLFGMGISCSCFLLIYIIFKKKGWLYVRSNKC